ncbi:MAG: oxidative damage protection protein [Pseudomonadales bacterium]
MTRTVLCRKYHTELEGLAAPPFPGPKGQEIFDNVSRRAWQEWQKHQTMLINEKHLNMRDADARKFLQQEMEKFLSGEDFEQAEGYVPLASGENESKEANVGNNSDTSKR